MGAFLRAGALAVADVLSGRYRFTIPAYQRPYAWSADQVEQLLDDAIEAMDRARGQADQGYFLGSIVLHKQEDNPEAEVVDGQQRLLSGGGGGRRAAAAAVLDDRLRGDARSV